MDVNLLKRFDLVQDVDSLYKEILRNCRDKRWYYSAPSDVWLRIDHLYIRCARKDMLGDYRMCMTLDEKWAVEKWMYNS